MIKLTRLNGKPVVLNADMIQIVEESPDTVITLVNHEKLTVKESANEVTRRVVEFRRACASARAEIGYATRRGDREVILPAGR